MDLDGIFDGLSISSSGLTAERARLDTIAKNLANANVVADAGGQAYRRKEVVFETILDEAGSEADGTPEGGVRVSEVTTDFKTPLRQINDPSHPLADPETGMVTYSNVNTVFEMVDLVSASRSYEANLKAMTVYREMLTQALRFLEA